MRKLQTSDLFSALRLIKKMGLRDEIKPLLNMAAEGQLTAQEVGIEGMLSLLETLSEKKSEMAIYELLAGPFEMEAKEIEKMDLLELTENLETLAKENDLRRFFSLLSGMSSKS